ncbi:MAG: hypothetical protein JXR13_03480 [Thalassovita sp.]
MPHLSKHQQLPHFMAALVSRNQAYLPAVEFLDAVIKNASELTWTECEEIGAALDTQNCSGFCLGIRNGMLEALPEGKRNLKPLIDLALKIDKTGGQIDASDYDALHSAGWSDDTAEDVLALVAAFKIYSILANGMGFGTLPSEAFAEMGEGTVANQGYAPVFRSFMQG